MCAEFAPCKEVVVNLKFVVTFGAEGETVLVAFGFSVGSVVAL